MPPHDIVAVAEWLLEHHGRAARRIAADRAAWLERDGASNAANHWHHIAVSVAPSNNKSGGQRASDIGLRVSCRAEQAAGGAAHLTPSVASRLDVLPCAWRLKPSTGSAAAPCC